MITFKGIWLSTQKSWEQLKSELNVRFAQVNDLHHAFTMLHKARQVKNESVQVYTGRLYALANVAFPEIDNAIVESQLVGISIDGLYHDFLHTKVMRENPKIKNISGHSTV